MASNKPIKDQLRRDTINELAPNVERLTPLEASTRRVYYRPRSRRYPSTLIGATVSRVRGGHGNTEAKVSEAELELLLKLLDETRGVIDRIIFNMDNIISLLHDSTLEVRTACKILEASNHLSAERMK